MSVDPSSGSDVTSVSPSRRQISRTPHEPAREARGPSERYYVFGGATADITAEGATKHDSGLTVTARDVSLTKITSTVRFSDELAEDAGFLISHLQGELISAVITGRTPPFCRPSRRRQVC